MGISSGSRSYRWEPYPHCRPCESASEYFNRKGYYSIIIQGVVDYRGKFIDAYIGWPGKHHDARVFITPPSTERQTVAYCFLIGVAVCMEQMFH